MDFIINELSVSGQYSSLENLINHGLIPLSSVLTTIRKYGFNSVLKKSDFWSIPLLPNQTFHELCFSPIARTNDAIRKIKSQIASLQNEPFWDLNSEQKTNTNYYHEKDGNRNPINNSGIAESYERQDCLISFCEGGYNYSLLNVEAVCNQTTDCRKVSNVWNTDILLDVLFKKNILDIPQFIKGKFKQKLDFEEVSTSYGLNLVDATNYSTFYKSFQEFERMTWQQIKTSDAFDYKEFKKNKKTRDYFSDDQWAKGIHKFRIDQKFRCFGYVNNQIFHVLRIDLSHKLSNKG